MYKNFKKINLVLYLKFLCSQIKIIEKIRRECINKIMIWKIINIQILQKLINNV